MLLASSSPSVSKAAATRPHNVRAAPIRARTCAAYAAADGQKQQQSSPVADTAATAATASRRAALATMALATVAAAVTTPAHAAAEDSCTFATLANGLQWCDLREGEGPSPVAGAMIRAHYRGTLTNGREFDSSYSRGRPLSFPVGKGAVIKGWDLSILGDGTADLPPMKEGGKRRVSIPAALAYGDRGAGGVIPPGATLNFDIELMPKRRN